MNSADFSPSHPPILSHLLLWTVVLFIGVLIAWAYFAEIDEVTRGEGKIIPSSQVQIIQNLEGGIISELLVHEGDVVEKDQILLRIDDTRFASTFRESQLQGVSLTAKIARLTAEVSDQPFALPAQISDAERATWQSEQALYRSRQQELAAGLAVIEQQQRQKTQELRELRARQGPLKRSYDLALKELNITRPLVKQGVMSEVDLLRLERQANDLKGQMDSNLLNIPGAEAALAEFQHKSEGAKNAFRSLAQADLNDSQAQLARLSESNTSLVDQVKRTAVRSPVKGTIKQIKVTTLGGVVQPGMDLLEIVPLEDKLLVEARIRPADIAFLHPGQAAMVKFTAYDFAIFGGLPARLEHISADTLTSTGERAEPFFLIRLRTERNHLGQQLPIIPGMTVHVDILTGRKTILDYLLKPLNRMRERALRER